MRPRTRSSAGYLAVALEDGSSVGLAEPDQFAGYQGDAEAPSAVLLRRNGLHIELTIDREHDVGATDAAGVADVLLESAITSIIDCEDSVATVDAEDKVLAYHNWLGLMRGDLTEEVTKDGVTFTRRLDGDRTYSRPDGAPVTLPGRALMLVRNVGHLTSTAAVLDSEGREAQEGLLDAMLTVLGAKHDLLKTDGLRSSRTGSVYVVKPKMHGPDEVAFTDEVLHPRREGARIAGQHREARHHGRGAADHTQPQGVHPRRLGTRGVHQHGLPRSYRRRDPHLDGGGADSAQGRDASAGLDRGLRGLER